jgi:hypothetical protein
VLAGEPRSIEGACEQSDGRHEAEPREGEQVIFDEHADLAHEIGGADVDAVASDLEWFDGKVE